MSTSRGSDGGGAGGGWDSSGGPPLDDEQPHKRSRKRTKQVRRASVLAVAVLLLTRSHSDLAPLLTLPRDPCRAQGVYTRHVAAARAGAGGEGGAPHMWMSCGTPRGLLALAAAGAARLLGAPWPTACRLPPHPRCALQRHHD